MSKMTISERLANLTKSISASPLPDEIVDEAKLCLLDFLSATLAAQKNEFIASLVDVFGTGPANLIHDGQSLSIAGATYAHAYLSTVEDVDDAHALASGMHLSATVFPAVLALTHYKPVPCSGFLRACLSGYEVAGRLARSMDGGLRKRGFHATGAIGPFSACAAAGTILGLTEKQLAQAFGIAASGAGGLFAFLPSAASSRHTHAANASVVGLMAALAAKKGVTGPVNAFEGPDGFVGPYSGNCESEFIESASPTLTGKYEILNAYHKKYTACGHAIPAITMGLEIHKDLSSRIGEIASVKIYGYGASSKLVRYPVETVAQAKFSLPVIFALLMVYGDLSRSRMNMECILQPRIAKLASKVQVLHDPGLSEMFPAVRGGRIEIILKDGQVKSYSTNRPIGMPGNELALQDVIEKFLDVAEERVGAERAAAITKSIRRLSDSQVTFPEF